MTDLFKKMAKEKIVLFVHCAAGIHRTGVFLYGLFRMSGENEENANNLIKEVRIVTHKNVGINRIKDFEREMIPELLKSIQTDETKELK